MSSSVSSIYRSVLRELNKMAIQPRPKRNPALYTMLREIISSPLPGENETQKWERSMLELRDFLKAARTHNELLIRYNPTHDMTTDERVNATARRVGLDQPIEYDKDKA